MTRAERTTSLKLRRARAKKIVAYLKKAYPKPKSELVYKTPMQFLASVVLSAQCTDKTVNRVTEKLWKKYKNALDFAQAKPATFTKEISSVTFSAIRQRQLLARQRDTGAARLRRAAHRERISRPSGHRLQDGARDSRRALFHMGGHRDRHAREAFREAIRPDFQRRPHEDFKRPRNADSEERLEIREQRPRALRPLCLPGAPARLRLSSPHQTLAARRAPLAQSEVNMLRFRRLVWAYYQKHGRHDLPWRPPALKLRRGKENEVIYKILVSEVMLQQTQVERVVPFYTKFLKKFPTAQRLAAAPLSTVLKSWQGLGYNRRAKLLRDAAQSLVDTPPVTTRFNLVKRLKGLPGVGPYTAHAVAAFAYNQNVIFVETNIRTAIIHHFFSKKKKVSDTEIEKILTHALPKGKARAWYSALMDYGAYLKALRHLAQCTEREVREAVTIYRFPPRSARRHPPRTCERPAYRNTSHGSS